MAIINTRGEGRRVFKCEERRSHPVPEEMGLEADSVEERIFCAMLTGTGC